MCVTPVDVTLCVNRTDGCHPVVVVVRHTCVTHGMEQEFEPREEIPWFEPRKIR